MSKILSNLYSISRKINKVASKLNDIETVLSGKPDKIINRFVRKKIYKNSSKISREISNKTKIKL